MASFLARHLSRKQPQQQQSEDGAAVEGNRRPREGSSAAPATTDAADKCKPSPVPFYVIVDDDELACEPDPDEFLPLTSKVGAHCALHEGRHSFEKPWKSCTHPISLLFA